MSRFREAATLTVTAPKDAPCPKPGAPGEFITDTPVQVRNDHLHRCLIADGSLRLYRPPRTVRRKHAKNNQLTTTKNVPPHKE